MNFIKTYKPQITKYLLKYLSIQEKKFSTINKWPKDVFARYKTFSISGKMIRGSLILFTLEMFGGSIDDNALRAASAIELFQTGILAHDDIIDQDDLRRNSPSIHEQYRTLAKSENLFNHQRFGESLGICFGDIGFFLTFGLLNQIKSNHKKHRKILTLVTQEFTKVVFAEMDDIYFGHSKGTFGEKEILNMYLHKTGRYTFSLPLMIGALLSDQPNTTIKQLEKLGEILGVMFQTSDDRLGIFGEIKTTGKPVGNDIRENKKTLYHHYLFNLCNKTEISKLKNIFGNQGINNIEIKHIHELIQKYEIDKRIEMKLNKLKKEASSVVNKLVIKNIYKKGLLELINYCNKRNK